MVPLTSAPLTALNSIPVEEIDALHAYFSGNSTSIPKTLMITNAETVNNVADLINQCFEILSDPTISLRIHHMRVNLLKRIRVAMEKHLSAPAEQAA